MADITCVNTIRALAADTVQKAKSGHPGMPMGMAPIAHVLWSKIMSHSPSNPTWANRDRFVLSNGHGCTLLYIMLHLSGYQNMTMDDLKQFRQLQSKTPGHPEAHMTAGVEVTTGPLGQGIANATGLAIAEAHMAATYNKPGFDVFDHYTYVFCGDGCLQEGVSGEASSLAGHLGLNKLILFYDDNKITIDGETDLSFSEDVPMRYRSYGWNTITVENGDDDLAAIAAAVAAAKSQDKPTLISIKTTIGYGSILQGKEKSHGSPLGDKDIANVKRKFGLDPAKSFNVGQDVYNVYAAAQKRGEATEKRWNDMLKKYSASHPALAKDLARRLAGKLPAGWEGKLPRFSPADKKEATRSLSGKVLNAIADQLPELIGGSADLTPSNKTALKCTTDFQKGAHAGRYLRFGVREHGMAAIGNGLAAYGGLMPFCATFLNFIQYCFPAVRLSALSQVRQIYVMTHDSICLGEDGPTHQPIEALAHCRSTPNVTLFRPCDGNETTGSYIAAVNNMHGPSVLALSRQGLAHLPGTSPEAVQKGAYILRDVPSPQLILVATGSEVHLALAAADKLSPLRVRVVSAPSTTIFDKQPVHYRRAVITPGVPTVSVEASSTLGWERYSHYSIGMHSFGESAPIKDLLEHFGFTAQQVADKCGAFIKAAQRNASSFGTGLGLLPTHFNSAL